MFWLAQKSTSITPKHLGINNGNLNACGTKPNCVSSSADKSSKFYIEPLTSDNIEGLWDDLNILLVEMGFQIKDSQENYLHFIAVSKVFGFVDDIEFLLKQDEGIIQMRSQSRVGYSDMSANKKRLDKIRNTLQVKHQ